MSTPTTITYEKPQPPQKKSFTNVGESCYKFGKCDCCRSATLMFLLGGTDGGGSCIGGILVVVFVMA